jgi:hypothetical protein
MIGLRFKGVSQSHSTEVGPFDGFRVASNFIRDSRSGTVLACYHNHQWQVGDEHFSCYECAEVAHLQFETADGLRSALFGPFQKLFVADGTLYADDVLFAKFIDESLNWHSYVLETYWPVLLIRTPEL